ncbi:Dynein heavy chain 2, axonemal, partial [Rhizoclosmatium hyalinum]
MLADAPPPPTEEVQQINDPPAVEEVQPVEEPEPVESISVVIDRFKRLVTLTGYTHDMWTEDIDAVVTDFIQDASIRKMILHIDSERKVLCAQPSLPQNAKEIMYFIKEVPVTAGETKDTLVPIPINSQTFEKCFQYGTVNGDVMESLLRMMQGVYVPMFMENKQWPES